MIIVMQQGEGVQLIFPFALSLLSFSKDVPKDYRHVSLTGVKQRFEDEAYQRISKEEVLFLFLLFL